MVDLSEGAVPTTDEAPPPWGFEVWGDNAAYCEECRGWHHLNYHEQAKRPRWRIQFLWYDLWVGGFYNRYKRTWYINPLPCVVITYRRKPR